MVSASRVAQNGSWTERLTGRLKHNQRHTGPDVHKEGRQIDHEQRSHDLAGAVRGRRTTSQA
jgi:hypothetical protein